MRDFKIKLKSHDTKETNRGSEKCSMTRKKLAKGLQDKTESSKNNSDQRIYNEMKDGRKS